MEKNVEYIISCFDQVFAQLGQEPLLFNPEFSIKPILQHDSFLRFHAKQKEGRIKMTFEVTQFGLSFWLDRTNEIPEWSVDQIKERPGFIEDELRHLFGSEIEVQYKGNKTIIRLLNGQDKEQRRYTYYQGLSINLFSKVSTKRLRPFFS